MKKFKSRKLWALISAVMACIMVFSLAACTNPDDGKDGDEGVALTLSASTAQVEVGKTTTINVTSATTESIVWTSDKTDIATVSGGGTGNKLATITGVAEGTATVTAKAGDKTATCTVTVNPAQSVDPDVETVTIKLGDNEVGTAVQNLYGAGDEITLTATASKGSAITWESSDEAIATVEEGKVTAVAAGEATITAKVSDAIKATVTVKVLAGTPITYAGESAFTAGWRYWSGDGDANVTATLYENNDVTVNYTMTGGQPHSVQLFYKDNVTGKNHALKLTLVSPVEDAITINGARHEIVKGDNTITVDNFAASTIQVQFGKYGEGQGPILGEDLTFIFKNIEITTPNATATLVAPSFSIADDTKIITITDTDENAANKTGYELGFFKNATDLEPVATVTVVNGEAVNLSQVDAGDYTVEIRAVSTSLDVINSLWSATGSAITVSNPRTNISNGEVGNATANPGTWVYWVDGGWCGATGTCSEHYVEDGAVHITYSVNHESDFVWENTAVAGVKGNWFALQLFYKDASLTEGTSYTLTLDITSPAAGKITINDQRVTLVEGENTSVSITFTQGAGASLTIQLGVAEDDGNGSYALVEGAFVLGNINITPAA